MLLPARAPATAALIAASVLVFAHESTLSHDALEDLVNGWGATPAYLLHDRTPRELSTLVTSLFVHGGWAHLLGNMAFLWLFGARVERAVGAVKFLVLYLACGALATLAEAGLEPGSVLPIVGASGAVSGVLGAYLALDARARLVAAAMLWLGLQYASALTAGGVDVAWFAHIGGFAAGAFLGGLAQLCYSRKRCPDPASRATLPTTASR